MIKRSLIVVLLCGLLAVAALGTALASDDTDEPLGHVQRPPRFHQLVNQIDYWWVGEVRDEGFLAWEATISGEINGTMKYWLGPAPDPDEAENGFYYYVARWEIWDDSGEQLLLAGDSAGKTVYAPITDTDGVWDGSGVVTEASEDYLELVGRTVYESGPVPLTCFTGDKPCAHGLFLIR